MKRSAYRLILNLHPAAFRHPCAEEMLWVFDQAATDGATEGYCRDAATSLLRHWLRNPTAWTIGGATLGGLLSLLWAGVVASKIPRPFHGMALHINNSSEALLLATIGALLTISFIVIITVALFQSIRRRV